MPEDVEIETHELQEHVEEAHHHATHGGAHEDKAGWTKYVALTTSGLAAFAAIGSLQAGALVNGAKLVHHRAADQWNQYQADRQKAVIYSMQSDRLLDAGATPAAKVEKEPKKEGEAKPREKKARAAVTKAAPDRLREYLDEEERETGKTDELKKEATELEKVAHEKMESHEKFAYSVTLLQVAIALGAVSALTKNKLVWVASGVLGVIGIALFVLGFLK